MNNYNNNTGFYLMPCILMVSSLGFYYLGNLSLTLTAFAMALLMWFALYGEIRK